MGEVIRLRVASSEEAVTLQSASGSLAVEAVSPKVSFEKVEGGTKMIVTDIDGVKETIIYDGKAELEFDDTPTQGSNNPVTSGGIYSALDWQKQDLMYFINNNTDRINELNMTVAMKQDKLYFDSEPKLYSTNPVTSGGVYDALHASNAVTVSGMTPSIVGENGKRYVCGTVERLTITPATGSVFSVRFKSGETPTVLSVPNWVKWTDGFDPTALDANKTYRLSFEDAVYAKADVWS